MSDIPVLETIELSRHGEIARLCLNRPDRANTVTNTLIRDFERGLEWTRRSRARVLIITGNGRHFCAGADLKPAKGDGARLGDLDWINDLEELRIPVIAAINGPALGGGLELAMACDLRLIADTAKVSLPEARFGAIPAGGGTQRLPRIVGLSRAQRLLWLGIELSAAEALAIGLVDEVVAAAELDDAAYDLANELATRPTYVLEALKYLVVEGMKVDLRTGLRMELHTARRLASAEEKATAQAAVARTDPNYSRIFGGGQVGQ
jgi:enoyl-CoA hydratase/carnithine racemase